MSIVAAAALLACGGGGSSSSSDSSDSSSTTTTVTAPTITTQPASTSVSSGSTATFTVVASGSDLTYQWYDTSGAISGATSSTYTTGTAGSYYVIVTNSAGSVTSSTATLTVTSSSSSTSSSSLVDATQAFVSSLSSSQQSSAVLDCTSSVATKWSNLPISIDSRNGIQFSTLSSTQLTAANALLAQAFSSSGVSLIEEIRLADEDIHESNTSQNWGYDLYKIALLCTPSTSSMWMLQVTGHHLGYTITYNGNAVSATPVFIGTEPPNWTDSSGTAHAALDTQRAAVQNLAAAIQADSSVSSSALLSGTFTDVTMGPTGSGDTGYPQTYPTGTTGRGVAYSSLSSTEQALVKAAIEAWVNTVSDDVASTLLSAYESSTALAETYVGYGVGTGGTADFASNPSGLTSQHSYLRIDGPRVWIEFVVQQGVAFPTQVHYHTVWRDKTADYGAEF